MNEPISNALPAARTLLKQLEQQFTVFKAVQPLAIGIDKQLIARLPQVNRKELRVALSLHIHSIRYLKAMEKAQQRFDLDGNPVDTVPESHRKHASDLLKERIKKTLEKRKEQEQTVREERRRDEKMRQLVEKFAPRR